MMVVFDYSRVQKECFWDSKLDERKFYDIINSDDMKKKQYIFEKILLNSTKMLTDLSVFDKNELRYLLENVQIPTFNKAYVFRRKNMAEVYFFNKELQIDELKWVA